MSLIGNVFTALFIVLVVMTAITDSTLSKEYWAALTKNACGLFIKGYNFIKSIFSKDKAEAYNNSTLRDTT